MLGTVGVAHKHWRPPLNVQADLAAKMVHVSAAQLVLVETRNTVNGAQIDLWGESTDGQDQEIISSMMPIQSVFIRREIHMGEFGGTAQQSCAVFRISWYFINSPFADSNWCILQIMEEIRPPSPGPAIAVTIQPLTSLPPNQQENVRSTTSDTWYVMCKLIRLNMVDISHLCTQ